MVQPSNFFENDLGVLQTSLIPDKLTKITRVHHNIASCLKPTVFHRNNVHCTVVRFQRKVELIPKMRFFAIKYAYQWKIAQDIPN
jgi:hypothetical protein